MTHCQVIKHSMELDTEMAWMLALSERDIKRTMINMLKNLVEKMDNICEQIGIFSREKEAMKK